MTATITNTVVTTQAYDAARRWGVPIKTLEWSDAGELLRDGEDTYPWDAAHLPPPGTHRHCALAQVAPRMRGR